MNLSILLIIAGLGILFGGAAWLGFRSPKKLLLLAVSLICLINFAFFSGEVSSRIAIPDALFCLLFFTILLHTAVTRNLSWKIPMGPALIFSFLLLSVALSLTAQPWSSGVLFGEGQPEILVFSIMIFLLITGTIRDENDFRRLLCAWTIAAGIAIAVSLVDMQDLFIPSGNFAKYDSSGVFGIEDLISFSAFPHAIFSPYSFRIQGPFRNPGQLATFAMTTSYVLLAFSFFPRQSLKTKIGLRLMIAFLFICAMFTTRMTALLSMCFGFLGVLLYLSFRSKKMTLSFMAIITAGVMALVIGISVNPELYQKIVGRNLVDISKFFTGSGFLNDQMNSASAIFNEHPFHGIGFGRFIHSKYHPFIRGFEIHSTPIQFLSETGVLGLLAYVTFLSYFAVILAKAARAAWKSPWRDVFMILLVGYLSMMPSYFYNRHLRERTFWIFISLIYIGYRLVREKQLDHLRAQALPSEQINP